MTCTGSSLIFRPRWSSASSKASRMSLPTAAGAPLSVVTKPILTSLCCALAQCTASASIADPRRTRLSTEMSLRSACDRSIPEPFRCQIGALSHGLELFPHHRWMNFGLVHRLRGEAAVRTGHHVLASDQLGEADQPFSD